LTLLLRRIIDELFGSESVDAIGQGGRNCGGKEEFRDATLIDDYLMRQKCD
jgi:hypothetical protein